MRLGNRVSFGGREQRLFSLALLPNRCIELTTPGIEQGHSVFFRARRREKNLERSYGRDWNAQNFGKSFDCGKSNSQSGERSGARDCDEGL